METTQSVLLTNNLRLCWCGAEYDAIVGGSLASMPIVRYEGRTFTKQVFEVEECWFVNCVLRECTLMYGGGRFELENTTFAECNWKFHGEAKNTMQLLSLIGLIKPGQTPPQQIQTKGNA